MKYKIFFPAFFFLLIFFQKSSKAQDNDNWSYHLFGGMVEDIEISGDTVWISMYGGGLMKINTVTNDTTFYNKFNSPIDNHMVTDVAIDSKFNKYIAIADRGIFKYDGITWKLIFSYHGSFNSIIIDGDDNLWAASNSGLFKVNTSDYSNYQFTTSNSLLPHNWVNSVQRDPLNKIWVGTSDGFSVIDGNSWQTYTRTNSPLHVGYVCSFGFEGTVAWIGTGDGIIRKVGATWDIYNQNTSGFKASYVNDMAIDQNGNKWLATNLGVFLYNGSTWVLYNQTNSILDGKNLNAITIDGQGKKWIGSERTGLYVFDDISWKKIPTSKDDICDMEITHIAVENSGKLWYASNWNSLCTYENGIYTWFNPSNSGFKSNHAWYIVIDKNNTKWFATSDGVYSYDDVDWKFYNKSNSGLPDNGTRYLTVDQFNNVWVATNSGIAKWDGLAWTTYNISNSGLQENFTDFVKAAPDGKIWVGYSANVSTFDGTNWVHYNQFNASNGDIAFDSSGNAWLTNTAGLYKFDGTNWTAYTSANTGLSSSYGTNIAIDKCNRIWFNTFRNLSFYDGYGWYEFTSQNSGLPDDEPYEGFSAIVIDNDNNKLLAMPNQGIVKFSFQGSEMIKPKILQLGKPVCEGDSSSYRAFKSCNDNLNLYEWFINDVSVQGPSTSDSLSMKMFAGDSLYVKLSDVSLAIVKTSKKVSGSFNFVAKPTITLVNDTLWSNASTGNQWFYEGNLLAGEQNQYHVPVMIGDYSVVVTESCKSEPADNFYYNISGIYKGKDESNLSISPNPANANVLINVKNNSKPLSLKVLNLQGRIVYEVNNFVNSCLMDISSWNKGIYILMVTNGDTINMNKKLIVN